MNLALGNVKAANQLELSGSLLLIDDEPVPN